MFYKKILSGRKIQNAECKPTLGFITHIAEKVVEKYVSKGVIPRREKQDVVMSVIEKFLNKREKIDSAFEGKSQVSTYYTAICNRMCCEIIRKENKHWYAVVNDDTFGIRDTETTQSFETEKGMLFKEELLRLSRIMLFFNGTGAKVNLFLKYFYDLPLYEDDIKLYCGEKTIIAKNKFNKAKSKAEAFENMAAVMKIVEGKDVGGDAARMWLNKQIETILCRLNANGYSKHDKESLGIMLEIQHEKKMDIFQPDQALSMN